jgi:hypothetical protein
MSPRQPLSPEGWEISQHTVCECPLSAKSVRSRAMCSGIWARVFLFRRAPASHPPCDRHQSAKTLPHEYREPKGLHKTTAHAIRRDAGGRCIFFYVFNDLKSRLHYVKGMSNHTAGKACSYSRNGVARQVHASSPLWFSRRRCWCIGGRRFCVLGIVS